MFLSVFLTVNLFYLSGRCARCGENVVGEGTGCTAMDQVFHVDCFTCIVCNNKLRGQPFYAVEKKAYCEPCYIVSSDLLLRCFAKIPSLAKCQSLQLECRRQIFTSPQTSQYVCLNWHTLFLAMCSYEVRKVCWVGAAIQLMVCWEDHHPVTFKHVRMSCHIPSWSIRRSPK